MKIRIVSIDVLRGLTILLMILVNNPGSWGVWDKDNNTWVSHLFQPLSHSSWHGATLTDLIFPFFIFIMGCSIAFAFNHKRDYTHKNKLYLKILKRGVIIFLLGVFKDNFPFYTLENGEAIIRSIQDYRIMGVLQRLGIVFIITAMLFLITHWKHKISIIVLILLAYWGLINIEIPGEFTKDLGKEGLYNFGTYLDHLILGESHLWRDNWEPEGILASFTTCVALCLIGALAGQWIISIEVLPKKVNALFSIGGLLLVLGLLWDFVLPINKGLWTSSYVLYTAGIAMMCTALSLWLIDDLKHQKFIKPALYFGSNALFAYLFSELLTSLLHQIPVGQSSLSQVIANFILSFFSDDTFQNIGVGHIDLFWAKISAHLYAFLCLLPTYVLIRWMYKNKIFIKV